MTLDTIKNRIKNLNYEWFDDDKDYRLNIISFRNPSTGHKVTNQFDDLLTLSYRVNSLWTLKQFPVTVDPGKISMLSPQNKKGCAILVPGQYKDTYMVRLHNGKYEALCQNPNKKVKVYRDATKDLVYNLDPSTIDEGIFGINIHRSNEKSESYFVDGWSAGCTVFKKVKDFNEFMAIVNKSKDLYGNTFTYTLI